MMESSATISGLDMGEGGRRLEMHLVPDGPAGETIFFRSDRTELVASREAAVSLLMLWAMRQGQGLKVGGAISGRFLQNMATVQDIYATWDRNLRKVPIESAVPSSIPAGGDRVATFFSGGVDSFYTLLKHLDTITDLVLVRGFDIRLGNDRLWSEAVTMAEAVAAAFDLRLTTIETNVRGLLDPPFHWGRFGHGPALAAVGLILPPDIGRVLIPSTHTFADLYPWGTHPILDPLWGTEGRRFDHDGCEATRVDKSALIARCPVALRSLRVCSRNIDGVYNCGRCEKCVRTMINLTAVGAFDGTADFSCDLDLELVGTIDTSTESKRSFVRENLLALDPDDPTHTRLAEALQAALNPGRKPFRRAIRSGRRMVERLVRRMRRIVPG